MSFKNVFGKKYLSTIENFLTVKGKKLNVIWPCPKKLDYAHFAFLHFKITKKNLR